jgi:hypothetical protein
MIKNKIISNIDEVMASTSQEVLVEVRGRPPSGGGHIVIATAPHPEGAQDNQIKLGKHHDK